MRVVECARTGSLDDLLVVDHDDPQPRPGQVVIGVEAAGVNYVDALFVKGEYQIKPPVPFVPGSEVAGTIVAVGDEAGANRVGERVVCLCGLGGFAEQVAVPAAAAVPIPDVLDTARAAAFVQSFCTAQFALHDRAGIVPGDRVLVLGGGGGVGQATVAVAVAAGASVAAVASTPVKQDAARAAGADLVLDLDGRVVPGADDVSGEPDRSGAGQRSATDADDGLRPDRRMLERVRDWSDGGVDLVLDPVGGDLSTVALRALGEGGRLLVIGFASGTIPDLPANQVLLRNRSVLGVDWGAWSLGHALEQRALLDGLLAAVEAGRLRPPAPEVRPLADAVGALRDLVERRVTGKVVLVP